MRNIRHCHLNYWKEDVQTDKDKSELTKDNLATRKNTY
jgi:hypothetical protein